MSPLDVQVFVVSFPDNEQLHCRRRTLANNLRDVGQPISDSDAKQVLNMLHGALSQI
jgi:hypothetical protein